MGGSIELHLSKSTHFRISCEHQSEAHWVRRFARAGTRNRLASWRAMSTTPRPTPERPDEKSRPAPSPAGTPEFWLHVIGSTGPAAEMDLPSDGAPNLGP